jgi:hypothetical protein
MNATVVWRAPIRNRQGQASADAEGWSEPPPYRRIYVLSYFFSRISKE